MPTSENLDNLKSSLEIVGDKWSLMILMHLYESGPSRFSDCQNDGINTKTLSQRLVNLVSHGLVTKTEYKEYPPRTEYEITDKGKALAPVFENLAKWGKKYPAFEK